MVISNPRREESSRHHDYIVPGLDMLIGDPNVLCPGSNTPQKAKTFCIPKIYIRRLSDFYDELSTRGEASKELLTIISDLLEQGSASTGTNPVYICHLKNDTKVEFHDVSVHDKESLLHSSKSHAIRLAKHLARKYRDVAIMTGSDKLSVAAALEGIDVAHINPKVYTGRVRVPLYNEAGLDLTSAWWSNQRITLAEWMNAFPEIFLQTNQYVEFIVDECEQDRRLIGYFNGSEIVPIKYRQLTRPDYRNIKPKTIGQQMLFDALLAPPEEIPIVIVSGIFGTGKTFATLACGLEQIEAGIYEKIFVCPRDAALGQEIGFLPGNETEKTRAKAHPIEDNLRAILRLHKQDKSPQGLDLSVDNCLNNYFQFTPMINMGGRSIANSFIIFDEFQDTERHQAKALLSRIGDHSKVVIMGDPTQITNPHLNRTSNGLSYIASKLAGSPLVSVITFDDTTEVVRSRAAQAIAELLR
ncbi:MAG: PhoH family protein [Candidatus Saccharibacteria bacterium]|nr:PhoH family protein [Candidatus Saccharibacteria bacterium]